MQLITVPFTCLLTFCITILDTKGTIHLEEILLKVITVEPLLSITRGVAEEVKELYPICRVSVLAGSPYVTCHLKFCSVVLHVISTLSPVPHTNAGPGEVRAILPVTQSLSFSGNLISKLM